MPDLFAQMRIPIFQPLACFLSFPAIITFISMQMTFYRKNRKISTYLF